MIADLMARSEWVTGRTGRKLGDLWGFSRETMEKDAAEASRLFRLDPVQAAERKSVWLAKIEAAIHAALAAERYEAVRGLLELLGKGQGFLDTTTKLQVGGSGKAIDVNLSSVADLLNLPDGDDDREPGASEEAPGEVAPPT